MLQKVTTGKSILISGGSIAGPAIAWWLQRYGFRTTLVERWPGGIRPGGQNIDVNNQGREVVRRMGLEAAILAANTGEKGSVLTDVEGNERVLLPMGDDSISPTNETEILRGTFAQLLYDATANHTEWRFGDQITSLNEEAEKCVKVGFQSGKEEMYDLVVLADGVGSRTRKLAFNADDIEFKRLGIYIAYFTMPLEPSDTRSDYWVITNLPGKRCLSFRPGGDGLTQAFLMWTSAESAGYEKLPMAPQIDAIRKELLAGPDWVRDSKLVQRAAKGLDNTKDLYLEYSGQVKAKHLSTPGGKIGMIGDAAYCGTPVSGAGTTLSLVGAYILAGEIAKHSDDPKAGLQAYEAWMAPFAAGLQELPPGVPQIALPASNFGIRILHSVIGTVLWLSKWKAAQWVGGWVFRDTRAELPLPDYSKYEVKASAGSSDLSE
ncbi:hypothetical protein QFC22_003995 [Naganishia vaughanmartiniae]|uniref:Uncharacterized protein n=1 Tax=Naganishia vaughanmartiniae TaxID=1424756 RepID=A0ACC2X3U0_9TREE|nr:hypothetical protein QFC22_003995 [Naganishia vaughanmartiniae]